MRERVMPYRSVAAAALFVVDAAVVLGLVAFLALEMLVSQNFPNSTLDSAVIAFGINAIILSAIGFWFVLKLDTVGYWLQKLEKAAGDEVFVKVATSPPAVSKGSILRGTSLGLISVAGLVVLGIGALRGTLGMVIVGVGLLIWGGIYSSRKPSALMEALDEAGTISATRAFNALLSGYELQNGPLHIARRLEHLNPESDEPRISLVFSSGPPAISSPSTKRAPRGEIHYLPSPGDDLLGLVEQRLGVDFSEIPQSKLPEFLSRAILDEFKLADDFESTSSGSVFHFRAFTCIYAETCRRISSIGHFAGRIGCPFCSMIAGSLAKATRRPVYIENTEVSSDGSVMELTCRCLDEESEEWSQFLRSSASDRVPQVRETRGL